MTNASEAKKYLGIAATAVTAIEQIRNLIAGSPGKSARDDPRMLLGVIYAITEAITAALSGSTSIEHAEEQIHRLVRGIPDNDAAARDELDAKFPAE